MATPNAKPGEERDTPTRCLPVPEEHWQAIVQTIGFSDQIAHVVELVLQGSSDKQIAAEMGLAVGTVKDYLSRAGRQTGTSGRVQLVARLMGISYDLLVGSQSQSNACQSFDW